MFHTEIRCSMFALSFATPRFSCPPPFPFLGIIYTLPHGQSFRSALSFHKTTETIFFGDLVRILRISLSLCARSKHQQQQHGPLGFRTRHLLRPLRPRLHALRQRHHQQLVCVPWASLPSSFPSLHSHTNCTPLRTKPRSRFFSLSFSKPEKKTNKFIDSPLPPPLPPPTPQFKKRNNHH